ncbi:protein kinase domain-containing protein, partial [Brevibacterium samyangense]
MTTTLRDPLLGLVLDGRYRVDAVVARGGMAMVYRGVDLRLDREIAVKVMHAHLTQDPAMVERFHREALNAAKLSHPNLVSVNDQGQDGDVVYLVMEYLPSVTLRKELKHRGRLTPRQAIVVMDAVLAGLEVVHEAGIIHRDLKPDNVLLGADGRIKLADFGLARGMSNSTTTKTLIGTVGYVAPELVTRTGADARTDLYTLGIMFYEMLTGSQPYTDEVPIQVAYRHVHDTVPAPSERLPGLSPLLDALVLWTTSRAPEDRPQSARSLREALLEARNNLTDDELDFSPDGVAVPAAHGAPVLSATIALDTEPSGPVKERKSRTDEIPYLEDDEDDPEDTT